MASNQKTSPHEPAAISAAADYGLDAPGVVRNLVLVAAACLVFWGSAALGFWSGQIGFADVRVAVSTSAMWAGLGCSLMAARMVWESKIGKLERRERLLQRLDWDGTERVLDIGCGRGLMLIGAAKRLTTGQATGIDIWQAEDLTGNSAEATLDNARREGVASRVEVKTADMRKIPFPDGTFDVVVSSAAIHNLYAADDRARAIAEVARVLRPGGQAVIDDIRHLGEYAKAFAMHGCEVHPVGSRVQAALLALITLGSLRPGTLLAKKAAR
jgi:SAM-dependent methyltransferase